MPSFAAALSVLLATGAAQASPWGQAGGDVFLSTRASRLLAKSPPPAPDAAGGVRFARTDTDVYGEFGLGRGLTAGGKVVYGSYEYFDGYESSAADGFTEGELFLQKQALETKAGVFAVRLAAGGEARRRFAGRPDGGGGAVAEIAALYGRTLSSGPVRVFVGAEAGYRRRFGGSDDQARGDATLGVEHRRGLILVSLRTTTSIGAARAGTPDYDLARAETALVWRATRRVSLQIGAEREFAGAGLVRGDRIFAGVWTRF